MSQNDQAAERSAHVERGAVAETGVLTCYVCHKPVKADFANRIIIGVGIVGVCSAECAADERFRDPMGVLIREREHWRAVAEGKDRTIREVERERDEAQEKAAAFQRTFDLRWKAQLRAVQRWQAGNPKRDLEWPDHADLVVWLLERIEAGEARAALLGAALAKAGDQFVFYEQQHLAKGTEDGERKAATNRAMAEVCFAAIYGPPDIGPADKETGIGS